MREGFYPGILGEWNGRHRMFKLGQMCTTYIEYNVEKVVYLVHYFSRCAHVAKM